MASESFKLALVIKAFDQVTGPLKKINDSLERIQSPLRRINNSFRGLAQAAGFEKITSSFGKVSNAVGNLGASLWSVGKKFALLGGIAGAVLSKLIHDNVEAASKLHDLSITTGVSVESLQTLGYAFEQSGGSAEGFQTAIIKFGKNFGSLKLGKGPLAELLKSTNPQLLKTLKNTTKIEDGFRLMIRAAGKAKSDASRISLAAALFGKDTESITAFTNLAKGGIEELTNLEKETPGVISSDQINKAESFGDLLRRLSLQINAMVKPIIMAAIPALDEMGHRLADFLHGKEGDVKKWAADFGEKLPGRLKAIQEALVQFWNALKPVRSFLKFIAEDSTRLKIALGVLAGIVLGPVISSIYSLGSALVALGISLVTTPIGLFALALAAVIAIGWLVVRNWEKIKEFFITLWNSPAGEVFKMVSPLGWLIQAGIYLVQHWEEVKTFFVKLWNSPALAVLKMVSPIMILIDLAKLLMEYWEKVKKVISETVNLVFGLSHLKTLKHFFGFGEEGPVKGFKGFFEEEAKQREGEKDKKGFWNVFKGTKKQEENPFGFLNLPQNPDHLMPLTPLPLAQASGNEQKPQVITQNAQVTVKFENLPKGARVTTEKDQGLPLNLSLGYSMVGD